MENFSLFTKLSLNIHSMAVSKILIKLVEVICLDCFRESALLVSYRLVYWKASTDKSLFFFTFPILIFILYNTAILAEKLVTLNT